MSGVSNFVISENIPLHPVQLTIYVIATLVLAVVINFVIQLTQGIRKRLRDDEALKEFPGTKGHWLFGNIPETFKYEDRLEHTIEMVKKYPKAYVFKLTAFTSLLRLVHPETIKAITATAEPKDRVGYRFLLPWIGDGLLVSTGHKWARNRRLLTPAFHFDILKPYVNIFSQSSYNMSMKLKSILRKNDESVQLFEHVSLMTFDSLMKCIFGEKKDFQVEGFRHPYVLGVYQVAQLVVDRFLYPLHYSDLAYKLSRKGYRFRRGCNLIHTYSREVIARKREEHAKNNDVLSKDNTIDFLDMLLKAKDEDGKGLTDEEIQAEVDTFMFEGHDTTASGISWCLYNLARHPEYQTKCRDEVNSVMGDREHFTWEDIHKLPFLTMCVKESLRIHPPVPSVGRETTKPLTFPDGRTIPAGIMIQINIFSCHHNPEVWENPEVYDPYRFTPENLKGKSSHAFIPFSAGPRNCIGQHFALHEMKVSVGQVLRHLKLVEDTNRRPVRDPVLVLKAKRGLYVKCKPID